MADFETWESLGHNAYGTVYRGVQFSLKREVAIFELDPALRKEADRSTRFWDEITFLAQLTDDRLVPVFAVDRSAGWIVMELMCGNCAQLLGKAQEPEVVRSILRQGLSGLQRLHEENRTHGDIRPHSLLINRGGRIKLSFSIGSAVVGGLPYHKRSMKYVAPEVVSPSFGEFGASADLYTLGFSVLELLLGPKFDALFPGVAADDQEARTAWMRWHADENAKLASVAELAPGAPLELVMVLDRLLKKKTADRYPTAAEALADLSQAPLVPIVAPEIGVTGGAAGGAALVSDVDRVFNPSSKYDVAATPGAAGSAAASAAGKGAAPKPAAGAKAAAAAKKPAAAAAKSAGEKKKKDRKALLLGVGFAVAATAIMFFPSGKKFALQTFAPAQIREGEAWTFIAAPVDARKAEGKLTYRLAGVAPAGLMLDAATGELKWTPAEAEGPSQAKFAVEATDESDPPKAAKVDIVLDVVEVNTAPQLKPIASQSAFPGEPLKVQIEATDSDLPAQKLTYSLADKNPAGATIDAKTGAFLWTAPAAATDTTREFTVVATDDAATPQMASAVMKIVVSPRNRVPQLLAAAGSTKATIDEGKPWTTTLEAKDAETPREKLKLSLVDAPEGLTLDAATGKLAWTPTEKQGPGKFAFRARLVDDGEPQQSTEQVFELSVAEVNTPPKLAPIVQRVVVGKPFATPAAVVVDDDLPPQKIFFAWGEQGVPPPSEPKLDLDDKTGVYSGVFGEEYAGKKIEVPLAAIDDGTPSRSVQSYITFEIVPNNTPPTIAKIADQVVTLPWLDDDKPALEIKVPARDPDDAQAKLKFALTKPAPQGATIDAATGAFRFTPQVGDDLEAPPVTVNVEVADDATPPATTPAAFKISFKTGDVVAMLRARLALAEEVESITRVVDRIGRYQGNAAVDQQGLRGLAADAYVKRGDAYLAKSDFDAAYNDFNTVVSDVDTGHLDARLGRAYCYGRKGDWRQAVSEYDDVIGLAPEHARAYMNRAMAHYELRDLRRTIDDCDRVIELQPGNASAYLIRGNAKLTRKDQTGALADLKKSVDLFAGDPEAELPLYESAVRKCIELIRADSALGDADDIADYERKLRAIEAARNSPGAGKEPKTTGVPRLK